jgi:hypothetical protein
VYIGHCLAAATPKRGTAVLVVFCGRYQGSPRQTLGKVLSSKTMGRFTAGNNADPDRLSRIMNAKQRLIGVCEAQLGGYKQHDVIVHVLNIVDAASLAQVDVQALAAQVEAKRHAKEQEKAADK